MSILIKGMEMPKENDVPTWAVIFSNGDVRIYKDGFNTDHGSVKGTAVPIPPHGRLIDADALLQRAIPHGWSTPKWVSDIAIDDAPTIIDAEE